MPGEFTSPRQIKEEWGPRGAGLRGAYGGPAKEAVEQQIAAIEAFVAERKTVE